MDKLTCPVCGMEKDEWDGAGRGHLADGELYCCRGCAEGTGCTCRKPVRQSKGRSRIEKRS